MGSKILNTLLLLLIVIIIILGNKTENFNYLDDYIETVEYDELFKYLENNEKVLLYLSISGNYSINKFESKLTTKLKINEKGYYNNLIYLELGDNETYGSYVEKIEELYNGSLKIQIPSIIYFENTEIKEIRCILCEGISVDDAYKFIVSILE